MIRRLLAGTARTPNLSPHQTHSTPACALATGQSVINGVVAQVNSDINKANGYVAPAYALVNAAQSANHCGPPKTAPVISHVTANWLAS